MEIPVRYQELSSGDDTIIAEMTISSLGTEKSIKGANLEYYIEDSKGNIFSFKEETINIEEGITILREINLPSKLKAKDYWFVVKVEFEGFGAIGKSSFKIIKEKPTAPTCSIGNVSWFRFIVCWYWWVLLVAIILWRLIRRRFIRMGEIKERKTAKEKEKLKNLITLIKEKI